MPEAQVVFLDNEEAGLLLSESMSIVAERLIRRGLRGEIADGHKHGEAERMLVTKLDEVGQIHRRKRDRRRRAMLQVADEVSTLDRGSAGGSNGTVGVDSVGSDVRQQPRELIRTKEAAARLGLSDGLVRRWLRERKLTPHGKANARLVDVDELEAYATRRRKGKTSDEPIC